MKINDWDVYLLLIAAITWLAVIEMLSQVSISGLRYIAIGA